MPTHVAVERKDNGWETAMDNPAIVTYVARFVFSCYTLQVNEVTIKNQLSEVEAYNIPEKKKDF